MLARRYELLAARPQLCRRARRREEVALLAADAELMGYSLADVVQVLGAGELDFTCAEGVRRLSQHGGPVGLILDLLTWLDPIRLAAIAYALPPRRRRHVYRNYVWARALWAVEDEMPAPLAAVAELRGLGVTPAAAQLATELFAPAGVAR